MAATTSASSRSSARSSGDDFTAESDVDVLVEFEEGVRIGLRYFGMGFELEDLFHRRVDFLSPQELNWRFRERVLAEAEPIYVAA